MRRTGACMQIASIPISTTPSLNSVDVGVAVLSKNLDVVKKLGQSMIKMMEQSVTPHLGQNIDLTV
ncbi:MAG: YjfB family protein [Herbinix sp.]|nr:YjfB family protein [Herbinix sp.]